MPKRRVPSRSDCFDPSYPGSVAPKGLAWQGRRECGDNAARFRSDIRPQQRPRADYAAGADVDRPSFKHSVACELVTQKIRPGVHAHVVPQHEEVFIHGCDISVQKHSFADTHAKEAVEYYPPLRSVECFQKGTCLKKVTQDIPRKLPDPLIAPQVPELPNTALKATDKQSLQNECGENEGDVEDTSRKH